MDDADATMAASPNPARQTALDWLNSQGLCREHGYAALLADNDSFHRLLVDLQQDGHISAEQAQSLQEMTFESELIGPYFTMKLLGSGAMGRVFHARHINERHEVALKVIRPRMATDIQFVERFAREAQLLKRLNHHAICPCIDWNTDTDQPWLAMGFIRHPP